MRTISLWQPWASAIAFGSKTIETRHWPTNYRGPLAIHAATRFVLSEARQLELKVWWSALWPVTAELGEPDRDTLTKVLRGLPRGCIVATCDMVDCVRVDELSDTERDYIASPRQSCAPGLWTEGLMGGFSPGRFAWFLENIQMTLHLPCRGRQGFFDFPDQLIEAQRDKTFPLCTAEPPWPTYLFRYSNFREAAKMSSLCWAVFSYEILPHDCGKAPDVKFYKTDCVSIYCRQKACREGYSFPGVHGKPAHLVVEAWNLTQEAPL